MQLVLLRPLLPDAIFDLRYASPRNIVGRPLYSELDAELEEEAAQQLVLVADLLRKQSLRLVIWDAFRSLDVQRQLLAVNSDEKYVLEESNHCKGLAVDVTLADERGRLLDMGTDHDDFTPKAHSDATDLTDEQFANRQALTATMQQAGFSQWPYEWWHFDFVGNGDEWGR